MVIACALKVDLLGFTWVGGVGGGVTDGVEGRVFYLVDHVTSNVRHTGVYGVCECVMVCTCVVQVCGCVHECAALCAVIEQRKATLLTAFVL